MIYSLLLVSFSASRCLLYRTSSIPFEYKPRRKADSQFVSEEVSENSSELFMKENEVTNTFSSFESKDEYGSNLTSVKKLEVSKDRLTKIEWNDKKEITSLPQKLNHVAVARGENTHNSTGRIVGGTKCFVEEYPFMVSIRTSKRLSHYCGGALISPRWIISAAHCFEDIFRNPSQVTALIGLSTLRRSTSQAIQVKKIFMHKEYVKKTVNNDIALIVLSHKAVLHVGSVGFVSLPAEELGPDLSEYCDPQSFMVAGWGAQQAYAETQTPPKYKSSPYLKCVEVPYITKDKCQLYPGYDSISDKVMCTLYEQGGRDACQGDSGGPLFCNGMQFGVVSWGYGCAQSDSPGVYTRVDKHLNFITRTIENYKTNRVRKNSPLFMFFVICVGLLVFSMLLIT